MANWSPPCNVLVNEVSEWFSVFFIVYRCCFVGSILQVVAAIFITETNRILANDDDLALMRRHREKVSFESKLKRFINTMDSFNGSDISWQELEELLEEPRVAQLLARLVWCQKTWRKSFGSVMMDLDKC